MGLVSTTLDAAKVVLIQCINGGAVMKKLTKHGNSLALVIEKPILDLLKINATTPLEVSTDGDVLLVRPQRELRASRKVQEALEWVNSNYGNALKRLAE